MASIYNSTKTMIGGMPNFMKQVGRDYFEKGDNLFYHPEDSTYKTIRSNLITLSPVNFSSGPFVANQPTQIRLQPGTCKKIHFAYLNLTCSETGGLASVTPVVAPYLISYIQIFFRNVGTPIHTITGDALYNNFMFVRRDNLSNALDFNLLNMTNTFGGSRR